eukprot:gene512-282_t
MGKLREPYRLAQMPPERDVAGRCVASSQHAGPPSEEGLRLLLLLLLLCDEAVHLFRAGVAETVITGTTDVVGRQTPPSPPLSWVACALFTPRKPGGGGDGDGEGDRAGLGSETVSAVACLRGAVCGVQCDGALLGREGMASTPSAQTRRCSMPMAYGQDLVVAVAAQQEAEKVARRMAPLPLKTRVLPTTWRAAAAGLTAAGAAVVAMPHRLLWRRTLKGIAERRHRLEVCYCFHRIRSFPSLLLTHKIADCSFFCVCAAEQPSNTRTRTRRADMVVSLVAGRQNNNNNNNNKYMRMENNKYDTIQTSHRRYHRTDKDKTTEGGRREDNRMFLFIAVRRSTTNKHNIFSNPIRSSRHDTDIDIWLSPPFSFLEHRAGIVMA